MAEDEHHIRVVTSRRRGCGVERWGCGRRERKVRWFCNTYHTTGIYDLPFTPQGRRMIYLVYDDVLERHDDNSCLYIIYE